MTGCEITPGILPDWIKIGPVIFQVIEVEGLASDDGQALFGKILFGQCQIIIDAGLTPIMKWQTLWHEILHAIHDQAGLSVGEGEIDAVAYKLLEILVDNNFLKFPSLETRMFPEY